MGAWNVGVDQNRVRELPLTFAALKVGGDFQKALFTAYAEYCAIAVEDARYRGQCTWIGGVQSTDTINSDHENATFIEATQEVLDLVKC